eukprot:scaffold1598_cov100-Skeletonema_dohrnii-CCMP3373.AAC.2
MKISKQNILTSLRRRPLDAMAIYLLCRSLTIPWTSRSMFKRNHHAGHQSGNNLQLNQRYHLTGDLALKLGLT